MITISEWRFGSQLTPPACGCIHDQTVEYAGPPAAVSPVLHWLFLATGHWPLTTALICPQVEISFSCGETNVEEG